MSPERDLFDVIGFGENSVDRVLICSQLPGSDGAAPKARVQRAIRSCGGQVATTTAACVALGLRARYCGAVGSDDDGRFVHETLTVRGIDVSQIKTRAGAATRSATILVDAASGERSVLWDRDDALSFTRVEIDAIDVADARLIHVDDTDIAGSIQLARAARRAGRMVTTDIDAASNRDRAMELLSIATHPILSEHALRILSGESDAERGLRALQKISSGVLCVTLGARGAMALDNESLITATGIAVAAIDTTGAGDVFRAGFIASLLSGQNMEPTLRFANTAAALSCTRVGAISGVPTLEEVQSAG